MSIQLTRVQDKSSPSITWVKAEVSGPIDVKLTKDEAEQTVQALVMAHQLAAIPRRSVI